MNIILETERCYLREFILEDAQDFYKLNLDPEVIQYTGDVPFTSIEEAEEFIRNYNPYQKYGFGRWAVCDTKTDDFLGFCGLKYHKNVDFVEVGYRFYKTYWNKGFATETAKACVDFAFDSIKLPVMYCQVKKENLASIRVAEKLGFVFEKNYIDEEQDDAVLFKKDNPNILYQKGRELSL
ncbi:MAG: GNAT family N-acetyltransferase [Flavobacteriaceae bacterium]|nr:GNAT family N-acetyltransferase [Flavobacteriaceae bacterium]